MKSSFSLQIDFPPKAGQIQEHQVCDMFLKVGGKCKEKKKQTRSPSSHTQYLHRLQNSNTQKGFLWKIYVFRCCCTTKGGRNLLFADVFPLFPARSCLNRGGNACLLVRGKLERRFTSEVGTSRNNGIT